MRTRHTTLFSAFASKLMASGCLPAGLPYGEVRRLAESLVDTTADFLKDHGQAPAKSLNRYTGATVQTLRIIGRPHKVLIGCIEEGGYFYGNQWGNLLRVDRFDGTTGQTHCTMISAGGNPMPGEILVMDGTEITDAGMGGLYEGGLP